MQKLQHDVIAPDGKGLLGWAVLRKAPSMARSSSSCPRAVWPRLGLALLIGSGMLAGRPASASAQAITAAAAAQWSPPSHIVDAQLFLATPAALTTGLSEGVGLSYLRPILGSPVFAWGARASWSTATEYSLVDTVRNDDIRLRLCALAQHLVGRGGFGLRLGLGATTVYEARTRDQGARVGLTGSALEATNWYLYPAADLDGVVLIRVWNGWGMSLSGGPTLHLIDGSARAGWSTGLGVAWEP